MTASLVLLRLEPIDLGDVGGTSSGVQVGDATLVALYLIPFSGIAFTWFLAALRRRVGRLEDQLFATVFLAPACCSSPCCSRRARPPARR